MTDPTVTDAMGAALTEALRALGTPARAAGARAYLKSTRDHLGVTVPDVRRVAVHWLRDHPDVSREQLTALARTLWSSTVYDRLLLAVELITPRAGMLHPDDLAWLEAWLREARTWALVDPLAVTVVGTIVQNHPHAVATLDQWAVDGDFWVRRAALLALLDPLRKGRGDFARFGRYADGMLSEREFFIRKAMGWVLRETGRKDPAGITAWLIPRAGRLSGVTLREALKPLSESQREAVRTAADRG